MTNNPYSIRVDQLADVHSKVVDKYCRSEQPIPFKRYVQFTDKLYIHMGKMGQKAIEWEKERMHART